MDRLSDIGCPLFIMSGVEDRHTTVTETRHMYSIALEPKQLWLVDGTAHVDIYDLKRDEYEHRVLSFLNRHMRNIPADFMFD